jgi:hypothetical protein
MRREQEVECAPLVRRPKVSADRERQLADRRNDHGTRARVKSDGVDAWSCNLRGDIRRYMSIQVDAPDIYNGSAKKMAKKKDSHNRQKGSLQEKNAR